MLPHFHAAGHLNYAKSAHLYLKQMPSLQNRISQHEFEIFTSHGYFTIRRSSKFWSGVWTDMTIEQVLMRAMKCVGGLTLGRGVSDSVVTKWVLTAPATAHIVNSLGKFCNISFTSSELHIELSNSRKQRDNDDMTKVPFSTAQSSCKYCYQRSR